jgi:hypothetical protein
MRKLYSLVVAVLFVLAANAQIGVTVTGNTNATPALQLSYASLAAALTDVNAITAMSGPITLSLAAGTSETAPATGLTLGSATLNPVLSATNTITIQKDAGAATVLNAGVGTATPASAVPDGMLKIVGADYITIDGLTFTDGNTTNPASMEFGVALLKLSVTDGAQYNTIKNCVFNMQRVNNAGGGGPMVEGSVAINVVNSIPTAVATSLTPTAASGTNSYNKFYSNTINGGNYGIVLNGYAASAPFTLGDTGNDVGGNSVATGNTILNYGGAAAASNPAAGVRANNQWGINISYNTVNNNNGSGANHVTTLRGIYAQSGTSASATINNNTITVKSGATTSALTGIENAIGSTAASNTININNNTVQNCTYTTATTGTFTAITSTASAAIVNLNSNLVTGNSVGASGTANSCTFIGVYGSGSATTTNIGSNTVSANTVLNSYGAMHCIRAGTTTVNANGNTVTNNGFPNNAGATSATLYGIYDVASPTTENYTNNIINNLYITGASTATSHAIYGIYNVTSGSSTVTVSGNRINDLSFSSTGAGYATVAGIRNAYGSTINVYKNVIHTLSSTGTAPTVAGIYSGSTTITTVNVYNNLVGNLSTPASTGLSLFGIYAGSAGTNLNFYYNTVYLNGTSSGTNFASAAMYFSSTTPTVTIRNNIFVNTSVATGTGVTAALRRTSTSLTSYGASSNNNLFYAGTPSATNLIYYDGTNADQTIADFKTRVAPRESSSISEDVVPLFVSTNGASPSFLHITPGSTTGVESGGSNITGITDDYDGDIRAGNTGYAGTGSAPDMGADEFAGISLTPLCIAPVDQASSFVNGTATGTSLAGSYTAAASNPTGYLIVRSTGAFVGAPVNGTSYSTGNAVGTNGTVVSTTAGTTFTSTGLTANTSYTYTIFSYNASACIGGPVYNTVAPLSSTMTTCAGLPTAVTAGSITYSDAAISWTAPAGGTAGTIQYTVDVATDNAFTNIVSTQTVTATSISLTSLTPVTTYYYRVKADNGFCASAFTTTANFTTQCQPPVISSVTPGSRCGFGTVDLQASAPAGTTLYWYSAATGGSPLATGPNFTTPAINSTTTYYVAVAGAPQTFNIGAPGTGISTSMSSQTTTGTAGINFDVLSGQVIINTVDIYPTATVGAAFAIQVKQGSTVIATYSGNTTVSGTTAAPVAQTVPVNMTIPAGTGYQMTFSVNPGTIRNDGGVAFPYTSPNSSITLTSTTLSPYLYYFYNWSVSSGCVSARTAVVATVNTPPAITVSATNNTICTGDNTTLTASSANSGYTYSWTPGALTGAVQTVSPASTTKYIVTATDNSGGANNGCVTKDSLTITVNLAPTTLTISPAAPAVCANTPTALTANGGLVVVNSNLGSGTTTNSTTGYPSPYSNYYGGTKHQMLVLASELSGMGLTAGSSLTGLKFFVTAVGSTFSGTINNFQIDLGHTTATALTSSAFIGGLTNVMSPSSVAVSVGTVSHTFTTPFVWDGTSNLIIQTSYSNANSGTSTDYVQMPNSDPGFVSTNWYRADGASATTILNATTPTSSGNARPNMVISFLSQGPITWSPQSGLYTDAAGAIPYTGSTTPVVYVSTSTAQTYTATVTAGNGCTKSASVSVSMNPPPAITTQPLPVAACLGQAASFTVVATGTNLSYQWKKNGSNITGATTATLNVTASAADAGDYTVVVTGDCGTVTSNIAALTIKDATSISTQPVNVIACAGSGASFTVAATGAGTLTYQWKKDGNDITGATAATFTISSVVATDAASYTVVVTGECGAVTSAAATLSLNAATTITTQPSAQSSCVGGTATFTVAGAGTGTVTYQWKKDGNSIAGATSATYTINTVAAGDAGNYTADVTAQCGTVTSNAAALTISSGTTINTQPVAQSACLGGSVSFNVAASGSGTITYQWKKNGTDITGATSATYSIASVTAGDAANYSVAVTSGCGSTTSTSAALTITPSTNISTQPSAATVCSGASASFTVAASGSALTYQWRKNGANISGATNATYTIASTAGTDAGSYDVVVTGTCGNATSAAVTLTVNTSPVITTQPAPVTACQGAAAVFNVGATGTGLTYQWRKGGVNITGATSSSYAIASIAPADAGSYDVVITGTCAPSVTSSTASLTVNTPPVITTQPVSQSACLGSQVTFSVTATGTGVGYYEWTVNNTLITGANSSSYTINSVTPADLGNYQVVTYGTCAPLAAASNIVTLTQIAPPAITTQPVAQSVCAGSAVNLSVTATGAGLSYQWRKNGVNIGGASSSTYTIASASAADAANYDVIVSGTCSPSVTSNAVAVSIDPAPAITTQPSSVSVCAGASASFTVAATGNGITYQWKRNGVNITGATSATYAISNTTTANAGDYTVVISSACGTNITSNIATLTVNTAPSIVTQPQSQTVCLGSTAILNVSASGTGLTYQWRKANVAITGATGNSLVLSNVTATDLGNYDVVITGACGSITSAVAVVNVASTNSWIGTASTDWNNASNWCGGVPTSTSDVVISSGTTFQPVITATASVRNLTINAGAAVQITANGRLVSYGNIVNNGTFNSTAGTIEFRGTTNQLVPAITAANIIMNGTGGVTLGGNMTIGTALTLTSGNITLGANNLTMTGGTTGSVGSHIVTNGTGSVINTTVSTATVIFPVGPSATSYNPVWIANGSGRNFTVRVETGLTPSPAVPARAINRTWVITPSAASATPASVTLQYADGHENASASPTAAMEVGVSNLAGFQLVSAAGGVIPAGTATGRTVSFTTTQFGNMLMANVGGLVTPTSVPNVNTDVASAVLMPNVVNNQTTLRVIARRAVKIEWTIVDVNGRVVGQFSSPVLAGQNDIKVHVETLAAGTYYLGGSTEKGKTEVLRFVKL